MKKLRPLLFLLLLAAIGGACWMTYVYSTRMGSRPDMVWKYHCTGAAQWERLQDQYQSVRVEVRVNDEKRLELCNSKTESETVGDLFAFMKEHPESQLWLAAENLSEENKGSFKHALDSLLFQYEVGIERIMVESRDWMPLNQMNRAEIYTVTALEAKAPRRLSEHQIDSVVTRLSRVVESGCISAIRIPASWYPIMRSQYRKSDIQFIVATPKRSQFCFMLHPRLPMLHDPRVRAVAVK